MNLSNILLEEIEKRFALVEEKAAARREDLFGCLSQCNEDEALCLKYLYAYMTEQDLANYNGSFFLKFVRQALKMRKLVPWGESYSDENFLYYVLQYRMNNEDVVFYSESFFEELYPLIQGKNMYDAALAVNYWCFSKATYKSTSARTMSPFTIIKNAFGRCGEESVFHVAALRSVGIPARQGYSIKWAHSDDNHAWTELMVDGTWYYTGSCEPEPILDRGWFTAPTTRGMAIRARVYASVVSDAEIITSTGNQVEINTLYTYADVVSRTVKVVDGKGVPVEGAMVAFELVNYSMVGPIGRYQTDANGEVKFTSGRGDAIVSVSQNNLLVHDKIDMRETGLYTIILDENYKAKESFVSIVLVPPAERAGAEVELSQEQKSNHEEWKNQALATREAYEGSFFTEETALAWAKEFSPYEEVIAKALVNARGNYSEIQAFILDDKTQSMLEDKAALLSTLESKDCSDITAEIMLEHVVEAQEFRTSCDRNLYVEQILAPRILHEMISVYRADIKSFFSVDMQESFKKNPAGIYSYILDHIEVVKQVNNAFLYSNPIGVLELKYANEASCKILFVAIARSLGIPACINKADQSIEYYIGAEKNVIVFGKGEVPKTSRITIEDVEREGLAYYKNYSVARRVENAYVMLNFADAIWEDGKTTYEVEAGEYRFVTTKREDNGALHVNFFYATVGEDESVSLKVYVPSLEAKENLAILVPEVELEKVQGGIVNLSKCLVKEKQVLAFLDVDGEPTQHFMNEMITDAKAFSELEGGIHLVLESKADVEEATLKKLLAAVPNIHLYVNENRDYVNALFEAFDMPAKKLPIVSVVTDQSMAINAWSGYRVGIGAFVLRT